MKKAGNLRIPAMSCKAFNGRIVLEYLAEVSRLAARNLQAVGPSRIFGIWLIEEGRRDDANMIPPDPKIPLQAVAMFLARLSMF